MKFFYTLFYSSTILILGRLEKTTLCSHHCDVACQFGFVLSYLQPPDHGLWAKGTRWHHFFQALKPGKIFFKGLTEAVLGVWKTWQNC